jgi:hypothetical protein
MAMANFTEKVLIDLERRFGQRLKTDKLWECIGKLYTKL